MFTFVCFKWARNKKGFMLPAAINDYTAEHVNVLGRMLKRHYKKEHRLVCITDDPREVECETIPLWDQCRDLGGCFNRLYVFSKDMRDIIGPRFACIDLDSVIVSDVTELFNRREDFIINSYNPLPKTRNPPDQRYNGGMFMMNAGARNEVWTTFDPEKSLRRIRNNPRLCIGSDQAWIRLCLGRNEARWGNADGVYEARQVGDTLPDNAKIICFAGARDPSQRKYRWVINHWR